MKKLMIIAIMFGISFQTLNAQMTEYTPFKNGELKLVDQNTGLQYLASLKKSELCGVDLIVHGQTKVTENMIISGPRLLKYLPYGKVVDMKISENILEIFIEGANNLFFYWTGNSFVRIQK